MAEFWETAFKNNATMWGEQPTDNAIKALELLQTKGIKTLLIPGFGYGRNAKVFHDQGIEVTGIEISKTAITRARQYFGNNLTIHHGSVTDMPYDQNLYDGIYCYSLIHLLSTSERKKLIADCYQQLQPKGLMIFIALSIHDKRFGLGTKIDHNNFRSTHGLDLYFYDKAAIDEEFGIYNPVKTIEINEPEQHPKEIMWMVICEKK